MEDSVLSSSPTQLNNDSRNKLGAYQNISAVKKFDSVRNPNTPEKPAPNSFMIKKYTNTNNESVGAIPIEALARFETSLFDLLAFNKDSLFKPEYKISDALKSLYELDNTDYSAAIVSNLEDLKHQIDFSIPNRPRLLRENQFARDTKKTQQLKADAANDIKRARVITVISNSSHQRPRKAAHLLVSNKTSETFEHITQIIHNALDKEFGSIKKIFNLNGSEVQSQFILTIFTFDL
jgi:hypothetical protein